MNSEIQRLKAENTRLRERIAEGIEIAKAFQKETGMVWGERIGLFLKDAEGSYFNPTEYNMERLPGEQ